MLVVYVVVVSAVSGWAFMLEQFAAFWYFIIALAAGFGVQIGLFVRLRDIAHHRDASGKMVAVSGGTSTAAMVSCCAHYLTNVAPVLGALAYSSTALGVIPRASATSLLARAASNPNAISWLMT